MIGNNRLEGKIKELDKQIAILERAKEPESRLSKTEEVYFRVKGVIKRKIIFKTRPKPIGRESAGPQQKRSRRM